MRGCGIDSRSCPLGDTLVRFSIARDEPGTWELAAGATYTIVADKPADTGRLFVRLDVGDPARPMYIGGPTTPDATSIDITIPEDARGEHTLIVTASHDELTWHPERCGAVLTTMHQARQAITVTGP